MTQPAPCPFCGQRLSVLSDPETGRVISYGHNQAVPCLLNELAMAAVPPARLESWNRRATMPGVTVCYEVIDGIPVFNNFGQGTQADAHFVNKCFDYLLTFWKKNQKS